MDLSLLTASTFRPHLGSSFSADLSPEREQPSEDEVALALVDIAELPTQPGAPRPEPFSLEFSGPHQPLLAQRTYLLRHAVLGELEIFLVPIGYDGSGGVRYQAVFN